MYIRVHTIPLGDTKIEEESTKTNMKVINTDQFQNKKNYYYLLNFGEDVQCMHNMQSYEMHRSTRIQYTYLLDATILPVVVISFY